METLAPTTIHGPLACRRCHRDGSAVLEIGKWRVVNDPGAWGSSEPKILILGFSKGFTQADAYGNGRFEDIPFKGMRQRLTEILRALSVLQPTEFVDQKMTSSERTLAFGSLVRCSLSRLNEKSGRYECTGQVMPKAFVEDVSGVVRRCAETFLSHLPASVRLVLMLGTTDGYVNGCKRLIQSIYNDDFSDLNDVSYRTGKVHWVHVSHPSPLNGHHKDWISGDEKTAPGRKRRLADATLRFCLSQV